SWQAIYEFLALPSESPEAEQIASASEDALASWLEYFSPEKTAERILDFALSYFPQSKWAAKSGDTREARQEFADYIGPAIQKGFDEAKRILGVLPEKIEEQIASTHNLVFAGLKNFVANGLDPAKSGEEGLYSQIEKYRARLLAAAASQAEAARAFYDARGRTAAEAPRAAVEAVA
ncbi:MAG: DUF5610 domain-containing protein, partial [Planctomycetota bacterium]|nr:DUF5610 domain-containing protein [Planctomycetota bacterium]